LILSYEPQKGWPVKKLPLTVLPEAEPDINCLQALHYFRTGRSHLLLVTKTPGKAGGALGVVTLEDIIEEIITEEIVDETDRYFDNINKNTAKRITTATMMRGIFERERRRGSTLSMFWDRGERASLLASQATETDGDHRTYGAATND